MNWLPVGLDQPEMSVAVVLEQAGVLGLGHLAGPDYLGVIDVRAVVYPLDLAAGIIRRSIANDDQMLARHSLEARQEVRALDAALTRHESSPPQGRFGERKP
jgi:hypothetical protein